MSNYTQTTFFTPKDTLPTTDPNKTIFGSAYDTEFGNIATAVATKYDVNTAVISITGPLSGASLNVTGSGLPANGWYLSAANALSATTNTVQRLTVGATGVTTFSAPTSGSATVILNGQTSGVPQLLFGAPSGVYSRPTSNSAFLHYQASGNLLSLGATPTVGNTAMDFHISVGGVDTTVLTLASTTAVTMRGALAGQRVLQLRPLDSASVGLEILDPGGNATGLRLNTSNTQCIVQCNGTTTALILQTSGGTALTIAANGNATFAGSLSMNGNASYAGMSGWGTPTGSSAVANFPGGGPATLAQCSTAVSALITILKNFGLIQA